MKKIGIIYGMENTFPGALVDRINSREVAGVSAEHVHIGGVKMAEPSGYAVIVDRISHDIPFFRAYLKNAALNGTRVINNPFWWGADCETPCFLPRPLFQKMARFGAELIQQLMTPE